MKVYEILREAAQYGLTNKTKNEPTEKQTKRKNWEKPSADGQPKQRSFKKIKGCLNVMHKLICSIIQNDLSLFILNLKTGKIKGEHQTMPAESHALP